MSVDHRTQLKQWLESGEIRLQPLTFPQRELWENSPVPVADVANHICAFIQVKGMITADDCQRTLERVVERQEALRLSFLPGKDQALQMVRRSIVPSTRYRHLTPEESTPEALEEVMKEIFNVPFDLVRGPLFRLELLQRSPDELVLVFAIHHAIADGWSLGVFVEDLCAAYVVGMKGGAGISSSSAILHDLGCRGTGAVDTASARAKDCLLAGKPQRGGAPLAQTREVRGPFRKLERWISEAPAELTTAVRELARQTGATLFSTLLTAFRTALFHLTGVADIVVGTPVANRNKQPTRETMGYFAGVVPLRGRVDPDQPFDESVKVTHEGTMDAFANAIPFAEIAAALGDCASPGHNPIFDVRFALQNHPIPDVTLPGMSLKLRMRSTGTARFDLACEVTEDGPTLEIVWLYRAAMFSLDDMKKLDQMFQTILANVCRSPKRRTGAALV